MSRCHNCDRYFPSEISPDGGTTCSEKCSKEYLEYLNEGLKEFKVIRIKDIKK